MQFPAVAGEFSGPPGTFDRPCRRPKEPQSNLIVAITGRIYNFSLQIEQSGEKR